MRRLAVRTFWVVLLGAILLMSNEVLAQKQPQDPQTSRIEAEKPLALPDLADLISSTTKLSGRLAVLEKSMPRELDVSAIEKRYADIMKNLEAHSSEVQRLKNEKEYRYSEPVELKTTILSESDALKAVSEPLLSSIRELGASRKEWLDEKSKWREWKEHLLKDEPLDEVKLIFEKAQRTIDTALGFIHTQLKPRLVVQQKAVDIQARIDSLAAEVDRLMVAVPASRMEASPPMLSSGYLSQFETRLWHQVTKGLGGIQWPGKFFARQGWLVLFQFLLALALVIAIFRHRRQLQSSKHWHFVGKRPFSAGLFVVFVTLSALYEGTPPTWKLAVTIVMGISFACLLGDLIEATWKKQLVYVFVLFLITSRLLNAVNLPLPLFRLYILLAAMGGIFLCMWWAVATGRRGDSPLYVWAFRLGALFFAVVVIVELWGQAGLAEYLFNSSITAVLALLAGWLLIYLAHGGLEWAFQSSSLQRVTFLQSYTAAMVRRFKILADILIGLLVVSSLLTIWRVYDSPVAAIKGLLSLAFTVGSQRISVGLVIAAASFVYGSFLISWAFQKLFVDEVLTKRHVDIGLRVSISGLIHYVLVTVGFLLALLALGFDLTSLTIIVSALGIGIGFGLQAIVNNLICGLILLFERPVKVGDYIEIGGEWAVVKRIGLRSTTVQTFDQADVIVPNGDLITNQITNWTHSDRSVRLIIPVRVAYGSEVPLVIETLINCATANAKVAKTPEPQVLFMRFGESSLDFELRVWVSDVNDKLELQSELHQEIDQRFRQAGIEIALPRTDLSIRSVEEGSASKLRRERNPRSGHKVVSGKEKD